MKTTEYVRRLSLLSLIALSLTASALAKANGKKTIEFTTNSKEARDIVAQIVNQVETMNVGPQTFELAKKAVEADPNFAFGYYLMGTTAPTPEEVKKYSDKAVELAKNASEGERRYIEAVLLARAPKLDEALAIFLDLAKKYPDERMVQMLLGQVYTGLGKTEQARAAYQRAIKLDGSTPRVYTFLGNIELLKGDYAKARTLFRDSLAKSVKNSAPFGPNYGLAYSYVYEGDVKSAIKALESYADAYELSPQRQNMPPVFIWNSVARLYLESGNPAEAIRAYEKSYQSVPDSKIADDQKRIWLGRMHHGKARSLARMGKQEEAWKEAELIKRMIEEGGKEGEQFWPSYHYVVGYLKLEAGDYAQAIEHLKQTDLKNDPFHKLLLARAYEKSGDRAEAQKLYREITEFNQLTLERALAYPEAAKRLQQQSAGR